MILARASSFNARAVSNARPASVSRLTARYKNSRHMLCPQKKTQKPQDMSDKNANVHHKIHVCPQK